jgi:type II secretory pathway component PulJ
VRSPVLDRDYPPDLQAIELKRVKEILEDLDWTPETLRGSRAANWSDLDDRMNYIVDFFRSHQQNSELFEPPFTTEQMAEIDAGRVPSGRL